MGWKKKTQPLRSSTTWNQEQIEANISENFKAALKMRIVHFQLTFPDGRRLTRASSIPKCAEQINGKAPGENSKQTMYECGRKREKEQNKPEWKERETRK